jgi:hypothetical protein
MQLGLKVNPYHGLIIGVFLYLISFSGSTQMLDERVIVPANGYLEWPIQVYPGQALHAEASVITDNQSDNVRGVLELLIMDDENWAYYESGDHAMMNERYHERISMNWWDSLEVNIRWFGRVHVVLNNKIRVVDRDSPKKAGISITVLRPYGYLYIPSLVLMGISLSKSYKQFRKDFM